MLISCMFDDLGGGQQATPCSIPSSSMRGKAASQCSSACSALLEASICSITSPTCTQCRRASNVSYRSKLTSAAAAPWACQLGVSTEDAVVNTVHMVPLPLLRTRRCFALGKRSGWALFWSDLVLTAHLHAGSKPAASDGVIAAANAWHTA